jgi:hypothetical protein
VSIITNYELTMGSSFNSEPANERGIQWRAKTHHISPQKRWETMGEKPENQLQVATGSRGLRDGKKGAYSRL